MRARKLVAGAALAVVVALAGCSVHPGAAAVVDGREITPDQVEVATTQLAQVLQSAEGGTLGEQAILQFLIDAPYYAAAADDAGVGIELDEARDLMDENLAGRGLEPVAWSDESVAVGRHVLVLNALVGLDDGGAAAAAGEDAALAADVTVNPRYGQRDPETGFIGDLAPDWIVAATGAGQ